MTALAVPGATTPVHVDDLWAVDLGVVADTAGQRKGSLASRAYVLAALGRMTTARVAGRTAVRSARAARRLRSERAGGGPCRVP